MVLPLLATLLSLFLLEGYLQFKDFANDVKYFRAKPKKTPQQRERVSFHTYHPQWGWTGRPLTKGSARYPDARCRLSVNAKGLRGKAYPYERSKKFRILALGDSYVWGDGVEENERFTEHLETLFKNRIEVMNGAMSGYGLDQCFLFFQQEGKKYRPDLVIYAMNAMDAADDLSRIAHARPKPYFVIKEGTLRLQGVPVPQDEEKRFGIPRERVLLSPYPETNPLLRFLEKNTLLYPFFKQTIYKIQRRNEAMELAVLLLKTFDIRCSENGVKFVILGVPLPNEIAERKSSFLYQDLVTHLRQREFTFIDPYEILVTQSEKELLYFKQNGHWTAAGHRVIAEVLRDFLLKEGYLSSL